jgi:hypothetical protein
MRAPLSGPEMMSYSTLTRFESRWNSFVTIPVASRLLQAFQPCRCDLKSYADDGEISQLVHRSALTTLNSVKLRI